MDMMDTGHARLVDGLLDQVLIAACWEMPIEYVKEEMSPNFDYQNNSEMLDSSL